VLGAFVGARALVVAVATLLRSECRRAGAGQHAPDADAQAPEGAAAQAEFRTFGKSKNSRDDLPQVVVGMQ
jgi:hypothetical protein